MPHKDPQQRKEYNRLNHLKNRERRLSLMRAWADANPERKQTIERRRWSGERARATLARRLAAHPDRVKARRKVAQAVYRGKLIRRPCEVCGAPAEAHHDDYSKPLDVRWLCPTHHRRHHAEA